MIIGNNILTLNYENRTGNLDVCASGVVKSNKFFPTYEVNNKQYIFKPLSKTKPLTTPLFSYAEVFWSNIINKYFCEAPVYQLAICNGYTDKEPKYYNKGCLVENILSKDEHLVNLLEYFRDNPDDNVNINEYINYCLKFYDYTAIFNSAVIRNNKSLGESLAMQVLISILKVDQNFHYENVAFVCDSENNIKKLAPMIDHEFSTMFLFPDDVRYNDIYFFRFIESIVTEESEIYRNLKYISEYYPNVVETFLQQLTKVEDKVSNTVLINGDFLEPCSSMYYEAGIARYKENDEEKANKLENEINFSNIDIDFVTNKIKKQVILTIGIMKKQLENMLGKKRR